MRLGEKYRRNKRYLFGRLADDGVPGIGGIQQVE